MHIHEKVYAIGGYLVHEIGVTASRVCMHTSRSIAVSSTAVISHRSISPVHHCDATLPLVGRTPSSTLLNTCLATLAAIVVKTAHIIAFAGQSLTKYSDSPMGYPDTCHHER